MHSAVVSFSVLAAHDKWWNVISLFVISFITCSMFLVIVVFCVLWFFLVSSSYSLRNSGRGM